MQSDGKSFGRDFDSVNSILHQINYKQLFLDFHEDLKFDEENVYDIGIQQFMVKKLLKLCFSATPILLWYIVVKH